MSKVRLAMIGNGMVGHRYLEELVDKAEMENFDILPLLVSRPTSRERKGIPVS